jgi:GntR family transcriptional regulator
MTPSVRQSSPPVYLQIRDAIVADILDGRFGAGDALPSVRALAAAEGVNPLTVSKAYQDLQADGLVVARKGIGLFAAAGAREALLASERRRFLAEEWPGLRARVDRLGLTPDDLFAPA